MKSALYARVSTLDHQTLPMQPKAMREYAKKHKWKVALEIKEVGSGAKQSAMRDEVLKAARQLVQPKAR
jgi:DNA invertase Pin-like site-specific DNA recombinase